MATERMTIYVPSEVFEELTRIADEAFKTANRVATEVLILWYKKEESTGGD